MSDTDILRKQIHEKLIEVFAEYISAYAPATFKMSTVQFSTAQVFQHLQDIFPSALYEGSDVYDLLKEKNFECADITGMGHWVWMMKRVTIPFSE
ncbi:MAG: hypothetical protein ACEQSL_05105 [Sediminibacterium sp.]